MNDKTDLEIYAVIRDVVTYAEKCGDMASIKDLIFMHNANIQDWFNVAYNEKYYIVLQFILSCDKDMKTINTDKALQIACMNNNYELANLILQANYEHKNVYNMFIDICAAGYVNIATLLVDRIEMPYIGYALSSVVSYNLSVEVARKLIQRGAAHLNDRLCDACRMGNVEMILLLIQSGATNLNECMKRAIYYRGNSHIIRLLIHYGANNFNDCMLELCMRYDVCVDYVKLMLEHGANNYDACFEAIATKQLPLDDIKNKQYILADDMVVIKLLWPFVSSYEILNANQLIMCLNEGLDCSKHSRWQYINAFRTIRQNVVLQTLIDINTNNWEHNGVSQIICDYMPFGL